MAINVNQVYSTVLTILNKEQRGYITPDEFNKISTQSQLEIFEQYFEDLNQQLRVPQADVDYSDRIENIDEIFSIGLNRAITMIAEAKPGRMSSSIIKDLGEHPEDKKPVRVMKGQYGPYIKYKSLNATIPEEKDPTELTMEEALILIEKRKEYDKTKKAKKTKKKGK